MTDITIIDRWQANKAYHVRLEGIKGLERNSCVACTDTRWEVFCCGNGTSRTSYKTTFLVWNELVVTKRLLGNNCCSHEEELEALTKGSCKKVLVWSGLARGFFFLILITLQVARASPYFFTTISKLRHYLGNTESSIVRTCIFQLQGVK